jgi:DNA-binding transcriptional MerR regulator
MQMMNKSRSRNGTWRIGELARASGVSTDTLRHYEQKGVLRAQRADNGYREYVADSLERVQLIRKALAIGFTLAELREVLHVFDRGGAPCHQVRSLAASKLSQIEAHLQEVISLRDALKDALKDWDQRLGKTASGQRANLLTTLTAQNGLHSSTSLLLRKPSRQKKGQKHE